MGWQNRYPTRPVYVNGSELQTRHEHDNFTGHPTRPVKPVYPNGSNRIYTTRLTRLGTACESDLSKSYTREQNTKISKEPTIMML
jgi:hypothetical protein